MKVVRDSSRGGSSDDNSSSNSMVVVLMVGRGHDRDRGVGEYRHEEIDLLKDDDCTYLRATRGQNRRLSRYPKDC